ncbi:AMP-binding protein [Maricurvus nonylphenolicus]|uniref:AMP-binding protein n=1 Tax=Maricurvus nonylphenolicus TaxID=1008307 RepID=UPI0036F2AC03
MQTPVQMMEHWAATFPKQTFLRQSTGDDWIEYSWETVADRARRVATDIAKMNFPAGSNIAIWSSNSADWFVVDLAIMLSGHVSVPIYPAQDLETAAYILEHSETKLLFVGAFDKAEELHSILPEHMVTIAMRGASITCDAELEGIIVDTPPKNDFAPRSMDEVCTILYSSGTTGVPKGVMHTFHSIAQTVALANNCYGRTPHAKEGDEREKIISYLPLSHVAERALVEMAGLYLNSHISISASLANFTSEIRDVKPTFFGAVPRIWHKFKEGVEAGLQAMDKQIETDADRAAVREWLGLDQTRLAMTGSAPISPAVHRWYADIGLHLRESYSMTETFALGAYWDRNEANIPGCVGRPAGGISLKLSEDGEIHFKTPGLMKGYYKNEEQTARVIKDGWYATGDLGRIDEDGNLWVTGRTGSVFKTSKGKFVNPERLERELQKIVLVEQAVVFGHGLAQPVAVVSVAESAADKTDAELNAYFAEALDAVNNELPAHEKITALLVVRDVWSSDGGQLTPTLKIKRKVLETQYSAKLGEDAIGVIIGG